MKKAVWGTGQFAGNFVITHESEKIDFFIDSDRKKENKLFLGRRILHPDGITNWMNMHIYVPFNYYDTICPFLKSKGLRENIDFSKYLRRGFLTKDEAERDYQRAISEMLQKKEGLFGRYLAWAITWQERRGFKEILMQLQQNDKTAQFALISEAVWLDKTSTEAMAQIPAIVAPKLFEDDRVYIRKGNDEVPLLREDLGESIFKETVEHIARVFPEDANAESMANYLFCYVEKLIDEAVPKGIFAELSFSIGHKVLGTICKKRRIPIIYTHPGLIPGTMSFDIGGEMGESLPAKYHQEFCSLPVSNEDLQAAKQVWDYLRRSKLNRKIQPQNPCVEYIKSRRKPDRPILFFAGQNDPVSGMIPYTETTQKYHSPTFQSSLEAAIYLANLCEKNDWNFVFKPHPSYIQEHMEELLPPNTIYVETGDINDLVDASDVVITILSQTNYVALIRHKPVVMLGYNQVRGKGCTYEAFEKDKIEDTLQEAIENGFTQEQQDAFQLHIAQILKYYLYDDMSERELRYGRPAPRSISEFYDLERLLKGQIAEIPQTDR